MKAVLISLPSYLISWLASNGAREHVGVEIGFDLVEPANDPRGFRVHVDFHQIALVILFDVSRVSEQLGLVLDPGPSEVGFGEESLFASKRGAAIGAIASVTGAQCARGHA